MPVNIHHLWHDYVLPVLAWLQDNPVRLVIAMSGAAIAHIFFDLPGTDIRPKLMRIFPKRGSSTIETLQYLVISLAAGVAAMCILQPPNEAAAFLGGFSGYAALLHVARKGAHK
jgi:hypothetical protein